MTPWLPVLVVAAWLIWPFRLAGHSQFSSAVLTGAAPGRTIDAGGGGTGAPEAAAPALVSDIANVLDLLALTLRGGIGLVEAIEAVGARVGGVLGGHLLTVAAGQRWGLEPAAAWASVPASWQPAARALQMAALAGIAPADALGRAADDIRRDEEQRLEVATAALGVRVVLPLGLAFLPAFVLTTIAPVVLALGRQVLGHR